MKVLLAKLLCLVGVFVLMLGGSLLPVKVLQADHEKARRSQRLLSLCNAFGGGVFLATCFNALLPAVRHKFQEVSQQLGHVATDYPVAETLMVAGFFLTVFVEQLVLTCRKERPSFIDLETFNAGSDVGSSDSEHESPFLEHSWGHGHGPLHGEHGHPDLSVQELSRSGPLRLASLVLALSAHSVFEGLALGLPGLFLEGAWLSQNVCVTWASRPGTSSSIGCTSFHPALQETFRTGHGGSQHGGCVATGASVDAGALELSCSPSGFLWGSPSARQSPWDLTTGSRQVISCDKSVCTLQITDTTGSHQFPAMQRLSISKGHAFVLVFSVTSRQSLEELRPIHQQIVQIKGSVEAIPIMLVGNKCDEAQQREVATPEGEAVAREWKCAFMETSAKMNYNVKELFQELLNLEKRRSMSLGIDGKRSGKQKRTDKIKGKCSLM